MHGISMPRVGCRALVRSIFRTSVVAWRRSWMSLRRPTRPQSARRSPTMRQHRRRPLRRYTSPRRRGVFLRRSMKTIRERLARPALGGITDVARRMAISQPSVSNWSRVPADRVVAVEAATGVARAVLRPDLYAGTTDAVDDTAVARAAEYALLAALLARPPDAALRKRLAKLESDGTPLGLAHRALAGAGVEQEAGAV